MSMAIASDVDETSTGSSGNPVENEDRNMLADSSGSNQIDCTIHHYYEKLKDFAFDMPGGWTDATISLFIDTFKLYKDDFSRPHPDELKIWQKIVKRCVERSNNHKVFTVNSIMELAGSLKSHVLRNEYRKDDENFKMLCNDVVDIIPYFPNTTCDSVSQNLRLRSRTQEVKTFASANDSSPKTSNIDGLILKYCEEMNLKSERYCCNSNWNNISIKILKNHGIRVDVKKHLGDMKRKLSKELKDETDLVKKKTLFYQTVGSLIPYFDLMPPRTIKIEEFDKDYKLGAVNGTSSESSSTEQPPPPEPQKTTPPPSDGPRVYRKATLKKTRPGNTTLGGFPRIRKIFGITDNSYSSESDEPDEKRLSVLKDLNYQNDDLSSDPVTSIEASEDIDTDIDGQEMTKKQPAKKKESRASSLESQSHNSKPQYKIKNRKLDQSSDDDSSPSAGPRVVKRTGSAEVSNSADVRSGIGASNPKNPRLAEKPVPINKSDPGHIIKTQAQIELSPLSIGSSAVSVRGQTTKDVQRVGQVGTASRNKKVNFGKNAPTAYQTKGDSGLGQVETEVQHEARSAAPKSTASTEKRVKSKNIVTPINVKMSKMARQEASTSKACSEPYTRGESLPQPRPTSSVSQDFNRLERMEENTVRIIEGYKEKVKDTNHSVMQLIPKQHVAIPPVGVSTSSNSDVEFSVQPITMGKPPTWFESFITDHKKHEIWKMHQLLKMQQELVDMENKKLNILEKILVSLNNKKS